MTLPASGPISLGQVAAELGIALPLSLGDSRVRTLAGVPSGPITMGQLRGKSAQAPQGPFTATSEDGFGDGDSSNGGGTVFCSPSVTPAGGSGGYTYLWSFTSNPSSCSLGNASSAFCNVSHSYPRYGNGGADSTLQCVITDSGGQSITKSNIGAHLTWANGNL